MERTLHFIVEKDDDGKMIKSFLKSKINMSSRLMTALKRRENGILLNGSPVFVTALLKEGDDLRLLIEGGGDRSEGIKPVKGPIDIVFEDDDLLIINKSANVPVHPSKGHPYDSLGNFVAWHYAEKGQNFTLRCVNRLDRQTSGLIVIAKHAYAHDALRKALHTNDFEREYLAVVCGNVEKDDGVINRAIRRIPDTATIKREVCEDFEGDIATTYFHVLSRNDNFSLLRLRLETGRTHQIRVHMAYIGHPLVGDFLYGKEQPDIISRTALHSYFIRLTHPVSSEKLEFVRDMPDDMRRLIE